MRRPLSLLVALLLLLSALPGAAEEQRFSGNFLDVFDTFSQVIVYAADKEAAQAVLDEVHQELRMYHQLYDVYNDYPNLNNLKTVNDNAGVAPVQVDERLLDMVEFALEMGAKTNGRMNVALGSVLRLWHDYRTAGLDDPAAAALPAMAELEAANEHVNPEDVIVDREAGTLYIADPALRLDVGAVAKGYAVERVAQALLQSGVSNALLSIGGNVRALGRRGDGSAWRVGVQNPDLTAENQTLLTVDLENLSLVSSGSYQRYYTVEGKQYHHIIDPATLMPAELYWAVSVVTEDSSLADALSTALYVMPLKEGQALLQAYDRTEALWVMHDGTVVQSDGFARLAGEETK